MYVCAHMNVMWEQMTIMNNVSKQLPTTSLPETQGQACPLVVSKLANTIQGASIQVAHLQRDWRGLLLELTKESTQESVCRAPLNHLHQPCDQLDS